MNATNNPKIHATILDEIIKLIVAQYSKYPDYFFITQKGHFSFLDCNPDEHIEVRVRRAHAMEITEHDALLAERSVYLPTTMNDSVDGIYRVTFLVDNIFNESNGIYQMLMHPEQYPDYTAEKAANDVIDFLLNERIDGQPVKAMADNESDPETLVSLVKSALAKLTERKPFSIEAQAEFPDASEFIGNYIDAVTKWLANKPNAGMLQVIELTNDVISNGWFLSGYFHQTNADTRIEISGVLEPIREILDLIDL